MTKLIFYAIPEVIIQEYRNTTVLFLQSIPKDMLEATVKSYSSRYI